MRDQSHTGASFLVRAPHRTTTAGPIEGIENICQAPEALNLNKPKEIELAWYFY
jgi:hypothetical protein